MIYTVLKESYATSGDGHSTQESDAGQTENETGEAGVEYVSRGSSDQMQHTNGSESSRKHERSGSDDIIESDVTKKRKTTPDNI